MPSTTLTIRIDEKEKSLITDYAKAYGMTASFFVKEAALERIEDELDIRAFDEALKSI